MSYNILHISTGELVHYFDPQTLFSNKLKKLSPANYRRPPQFFISSKFKYRNIEKYLIIPDWVVNSIMKNRKMYKRLLEGVGNSITTQENIDSITVCFEEFEFIKLND